MGKTAFFPRNNPIFFPNIKTPQSLFSIGTQPALVVAVATRDCNARRVLAALRAPRCSSQNKEFSMLVLSRKVGERIHVGDNITVEIRRIAGNRVTIALAAPRDVRILRGELEHAAKEFHDSTTGAEQTDNRFREVPTHDGLAASQPRAARVPILHGLSTSTVGRDFAI
jgi:carbon storage regulator CsrA